MLKNILDLDGVQELNKSQQHAINGGKRIRNLQGTGNIWYTGGQAQACECSYEVKEGGFLGIGGTWTTHYGPCPVGNLEYSCIPE
ncbi:hypothetical protein [Kordia sp.]|uniref:hypothetical protein n=1 Tax=Kordia sp. TaxID=1965332 RepID=UPI003B5CFC66